MDSIDRHLIQALRSNARATYTELGRLVGLSGPSVTDRLNRLEHAGVITGYHAAIAPEAIGLGVSAIVGIYQTDAADQDEIAEHLRAVAEIEDCWAVAGDESFIVKVRVPDIDSLERTLARLRRTPGVARTRTTVVLSTRWEGRVSALQPDEPGLAEGDPS